MSNIKQRFKYLEEANDVLRMQSHILAITLRGPIRSLSPDMANDVVESIQLAFEDMLAELSYGNSPHTDLFHDVTCTFFREKDH